MIVSLALFLTAFVMAPIGREAYRAGIEPLIAGQITQSVRPSSGPRRRSRPSC